MTGVFEVDSQLTLVPIIHGSGEYARALEAWLAAHPIQALAIPLPASFAEPVCSGVLKLPKPTIAVQAPFIVPQLLEELGADDDWDDDFDDEIESSNEFDDSVPELFESTSEPSSYVPIEPCQAIIAAIRFGLGERVPLHFIDKEVSVFSAEPHWFPDAFVLREVSLETFAASILPVIQPPSDDQVRSRIAAMAYRLRRITQSGKSVVALCDMFHWPWLRESYLSLDATSPVPDDEPTHEVELYGVDERTLIFHMTELPFVAGVHEQTRQESFAAEHNLSIDAVKQLLMSARSSYMTDLGPRGRRITPLLLSQCLKYIRNLTLLDNRLTPDLYTIAIASKQILGDQFAIHVVEAARNYPFADDADLPTVTMSLGKARLPDGEVVATVNRLGGSPEEWRSLELNRKPPKQELQRWQMQWNPYQQCSWPPEDTQIESFRTRVLERARSVLGADLARTEKFTTSMMDGLDIRETMRHWYDGGLYVKIQPPTIGHLEVCVFLFEQQADPRDYAWRTTWYAEHDEESTLAFFATDFKNEILGPGVAVATYGGAMFIYPPRYIADIWRDKTLDFADTMEDRLIAAACMHSTVRHIALLAPSPPNAIARSIARRFGKRLVHVPLSQFNDAIIQQLRTVHVLNGQHIRSFASHFIRKA